MPKVVVQSVAVLTAIVSLATDEGQLTQLESDRCISALSMIGACAGCLEPKEWYQVMCDGAEIMPGLEEIMKEQQERLAESLSTIVPRD
jgi:hypothetical protein